MNFIKKIFCKNKQEATTKISKYPQQFEITEEKWDRIFKAEELNDVVKVYFHDHHPFISIDDFNEKFNQKDLEYRSCLGYSLSDAFGNNLKKILKSENKELIENLEVVTKLSGRHFGEYNQYKITKTYPGVKCIYLGVTYDWEHVYLFYITPNDVVDTSVEYYIDSKKFTSMDEMLEWMNKYGYTFKEKTNKCKLVSLDSN